MYADYDYYKNTYRGRMGEDDFAVCGAAASRLMDGVTDDRAATAPKSMAARLRDCCCEVADNRLALAQAGEATHGGLLSAANNDGYSESYTGFAAAEARLAHSAEAICTRWLTAPVNLMYLGVG